VGDERQQINSALLLTFARRAAAEGTVPLVIYLPSRGDLEGLDRSAKDKVLAVLQQSRVHYLDMTSCIKDVGLERAFVAGRRHYSAEGNAAVAQCLLPAVRSQFRRE